MRQRLLTALLILATAVWIIALGWLDMDAKAEGDTDRGWFLQRYRYCGALAFDGSCAHYRYGYRRVRNHVYHLPEQHPTRVFSYEKRRLDDDRDRDDPRRQCLNATLDVLSTEHSTEDNAREAARKLMMAKIQWTAGGQYMDLSNAADIRWRCSASNAHDTVSGRLSEATAKLTGREGQNVRCALWVKPCKAPKEKDRDEKRGR